MKKATCVIRLGPCLVPEAGQFDQLIAAAGDLNSVQCYDAPAGEALPDPDRVHCAVLTGSAAMVTDHHPWSELAAEWTQRYLELERPLLGICYGHQLIAYALGAPVGKNPAGREIGTIEVKLSPAAQHDPVFGNLPKQLRVHSSHLESVLALPPGAELLGSSARDAHQVVRFAPCAWGVQFHPEFTAQVMRGYIDQRSAAVRDEGGDPQALRDAVASTNDGPQLLRAFFAYADR
ncbi:MAG: glutamine amidotransferase [Deltaproteobacteria bacterium]|nr:glutamine amidotransferase [Deltaproteobacteria bacterium]